MTLIVEDGTGKVDAESYGSVAAANTYHTNRLNTGWDDFSDAEKEGALRKASQYIDITYGSRFPGYQLTSTQALLWPRVWTIYGQGGTGGYFGPTPISPVLPNQVVQATFEAALRAASADLLPDTDAPVASTTVGPLSVTYFQGDQRGKTYPLIDRIIQIVLGGGGGGTVERG